MKTWQYWITAEVFERSGLDDGSGWFEPLTDCVIVEAATFLEARRKGRAEVQKDPKSVVWMNRRDGVHAFHGEHCQIVKVGG